MCNDQYSESGAPIAPSRCAEFGLIAGRLDIASNFIDMQRDKITALKGENARLREALKAVFAVVEGTESVPSAMGVSEYIVRVIGNAIKEVG